MLAYMDGLKFDQFEISPTYKITYTWSPERIQFNEEELKDQIKKIMAVGDKEDPTPSDNQ